MGSSSPHGSFCWEAREGAARESVLALLGGEGARWAARLWLGGEVPRVCRSHCSSCCYCCCYWWDRQSPLVMALDGCRLAGIEEEAPGGGAGGEALSGGFLVCLDGEVTAGALEASLELMVHLSHPLQYCPIHSGRTLGLIREICCLTLPGKKEKKDEYKSNILHTQIYSMLLFNTSIT